MGFKFNVIKAVLLLSLSQILLITNVKADVIFEKTGCKYIDGEKTIIDTSKLKCSNQPVFGNNIYFRGSNNETVAALEANHELFEVSCSWDNQEIENKKIFHAKEYFEKLWNNQVDNIIVVPIPEIIFKKIAVYNQGKLILKNEINYDDAIIADITDTNSFFVHNNLADNVDIDKTFDYKNFIRYSLKEYKESYYYFGDISYIKIKES